MDRDMTVYEQRGFAVRFGWGPNGLRRLAPLVDAVVVVDVLSFSTSVDIALGRGVTVFPYRWHNGTEHEFADSVDAVVASKTAEPGKWSLRPSSLVDAPSGLRLVLPSPNGSALTFGAEEAGAKRVIVGCVRNASAVAAALDDVESVAVIAAGERWRGSTGPLRPAIEDSLGAGAIIEGLGRSSLSPEALVAHALWTGAAESGRNISWLLRECGSGRELRKKGYPHDVELAAELNISALVPTLRGLQLVDVGDDGGDLVG